MRKYCTKSVITPLVIILFLILYFLEAAQLSKPMIDGVPQETFFPLIICALGMIGAVSLFIPAVIEAHKSEVVPRTEPINLKPLYIALLTAALVFFFNSLGYFIVAPIYLFLLMIIFDDKPKDFLKKIIYAAIITVAIYFLYAYIFDINFPEIWR